MGLNLGTLITILGALILFIVLDGVRRAWKERRNGIALKIDKRFENLPDAPDVNPELPGGVRRRPRHAAGEISDTQPPLVLEPDSRPVAAKPLVQVGLFDDDDAETPGPRVSLPEPESEPEPEPKELSRPSASVVPAAPEVSAVKVPSNVSVKEQAPPPVREAAPASRQEPQLLDVIVAYLLVPADRPMAGRDLLQALLEQGLRYGEMNIFHRHHGSGKNSDLLFSVANALEPGTFDLDAMESQQFRAITFFMKFPGPSRPIEAFEIMEHTLLHLAQQFDAELRDEHRNPLTQQALGHLREQVQELERRARLAEARQE